MYKLVILFIILLSICPQVIGQSNELSHFVNDWNSNNKISKAKNNEISKLGDYSIEKKIIYHERKYVFLKRYRFGDSLEILCKKKNIFSSYFIKSIFIKYPICFSYDKIIIGATNKDEIIILKGEPIDKFDSEYVYEEIIYYFQDLTFPLLSLNREDLEKLNNKVIAIKLYGTGK